MSTVRPATTADLPFLGPVEDAADQLFTDRFGATGWPAASSGEERAAEPGFLLVATEDDRSPEDDAAPPHDAPPSKDDAAPSEDDARPGERVVGFAHVLDLGGRYHLEQIAVLPGAGRRGHGSALLSALALEVARRGGEEVTLMTYADIPWNAPFYARHGWVELDAVPAHLTDIHDAETAMGMPRHGRRVVMTRRLATPAGRDLRTGEPPSA